MYTVLARKYRPGRFEEVCGQKHITRVLQNAIKEDKVAHAYLFSGPRGTGKTSVARIFAKALNCEKDTHDRPCQECSSCKAITAGASFDVLEIDGASNRGIEEIRNLRDNVNLRPAKDRFKIYIIDEVHMLTPEACNALLKTLEEPPSYVKFFFATTAPEKIIPTILSRCQRFNFRPLSMEEVVLKLNEICNSEKIKIDQESLKVIYEFCGGSLRDALSILDQLIVNAIDNHITFEATKEFLGIADEAGVIQLLSWLKARDIKNSIEMFHKMLNEGKDPAVILDGFVKKIRLLVLISTGQEKPESPQDIKLSEEFKDTDLETLLNVVTMILEYRDKLRISSLPIILVEVLLFKMSQMLGTVGATVKVEPVEMGLFDRKEQTDEKQKSAIKETEKNIFEGEEKTIASKKEPHREEEKSDRQIYTTEELLTKWDIILSEIKKNKPTLVAALREGIPEKQGEDKILLTFGAKYSFHKSKVEQPSNKKLIEKTVSEIAGRPLEVVFHLEASTKETIINSNEVKKVVDFFNGEIIKLEE